MWSRKLLSRQLVTNTFIICIKSDQTDLSRGTNRYKTTLFRSPTCDCNRNYFHSITCHQHIFGIALRNCKKLHHPSAIALVRTQIHFISQKRRKIIAMIVIAGVKNNWMLSPCSLISQYILVLKRFIIFPWQKGSTILKSSSILETQIWTTYINLKVSIVIFCASTNMTDQAVTL